MESFGLLLFVILVNAHYDVSIQYAGLRRLYGALVFLFLFTFHLSTNPDFFKYMFKVALASPVIYGLSYLTSLELKSSLPFISLFSSLCSVAAFASSFVLVIADLSNDKHLPYIRVARFFQTLTMMVYAMPILLNFGLSAIYSPAFVKELKNNNGRVTIAIGLVIFYPWQALVSQHAGYSLSEFVKRRSEQFKALKDSDESEEESKQEIFNEEDTKNNEADSDSGESRTPTSSTSAAASTTPVSPASSASSLSAAPHSAHASTTPVSSPTPALRPAEKKPTAIQTEDAFAWIHPSLLKIIMAFYYHIVYSIAYIVFTLVELARGFAAFFSSLDPSFSKFSCPINEFRKTYQKTVFGKPEISMLKTSMASTWPMRIGILGWIVIGIYNQVSLFF